jgi:hypothetical protein
LYGGKEARLLIEKMRSGDVVPKLAWEHHTIAIRTPLSIRK